MRDSLGAVARIPPKRRSTEGVMRLFVLMLLGTAICVGSAIAGPKGRGRIPADVRVSKSEACGECHEDIYKMWRSSAHSRSLEDPVFLKAYRETGRSEGKDVARVCLSCHGPAAALMKDPELEQKVSWEGVGCDICHGIASVELSETASPRIEYALGGGKRGPIEDAVDIGHEVVYSELHKSSLVCAPCHEYRNPQGTKIMSTYSEWVASPASGRDVTCQHCHMSRVKAEVVDPKVARIPNANVNLHEVPGGHSQVQLNKALSVNLHSNRVKGQLLVRVGLKNDGAGHSVPTGMPGRRVIMRLKVKTSTGESFEEEKIYGQTFADSSGNPVTKDSGYFARGVKPVSDTRIQAGEERVESFAYDVLPTATTYVKLDLDYEHLPVGTKEDWTHITFYSTERVVPSAVAGR
jgi:hypothetical protein